MSAVSINVGAIYGDGRVPAFIGRSVTNTSRSNGQHDQRDKYEASDSQNLLPVHFDLISFGLCTNKCATKPQLNERLKCHTLIGCGKRT